MAGTVVGFVAGDGHGQSAGFLRVLDLHVAVAEGEELFAGDFVFAQDAFNHHFLGKLFVIIDRAVNVFAEIAGDVQQLRLLPNIRFVRAAGEVKRKTAAAQVLQQWARAKDEKIIGPERAIPQTVDAMGNPFIQPA